MTMSVIRALMLDLDDTLVGTKEANYQAYRLACERQGLAFTRADFAANWGRDSRVFLREVFDGVPDHIFERIRTDKQAFYPEQLTESRLNEPLVSFVTSLTDVTLILVTTAKRQNAELVLRLHGLDELFDFRVFGNDVVHGKPHPECYLRALEICNLQPSSALAFEDSAYGIQSASAAGIPTIRVEYFA